MKTSDQQHLLKLLSRLRTASSELAIVKSSIFISENEIVHIEKALCSVGNVALSIAEKLPKSCDKAIPFPLSPPTQNPADLVRLQPLRRYS